jgi:hypothetical protein
MIASVRLRKAAAVIRWASNRLPPPTSGKTFRLDLTLGKLNSDQEVFPTPPHQPARLVVA